MENCKVEKQAMFKGYTARINQSLNDCFDTLNSIENKGFNLYNVPRPEQEKINSKPSEPSDFVGALNQLEMKVNDLAAKLNTVNNHFGELI